MKKTNLYYALAATAMFATAPTTASAAIITGLNAVDGVGVCLLGGTYPACSYGVSDVAAGSYFSMDSNGDGSVTGAEKVVIDVLYPLNFDDITMATGSHAGSIDGSESPVFDIFEWFGGTGMHYWTSPVVDNGDGTIDMSGWAMAVNGIAHMALGGDPANFAGDTGLATITCGACNDGDAFALTYTAHIPLGDPSGFGGIAYALTLEGTVSAVPVPAAVWLFGSGLLALVGVARRKSRV